MGTVALARPGRAELGSGQWPQQFWQVRTMMCAALIITTLTASIGFAETRPNYGGTLRVMMQSAPSALDLSNSPNTFPADYWDLARTLSLVGDTLVTLDAQGRPQPALAVAWKAEAGARRCQFTIRRGLKFQDGSAASPAAIAQILGALHPAWTARAMADSISIESETPMPSLLAELALPRNLVFKSNKNAHLPIGTGAFLVTEWQPGKLLKLAANEESWRGRPFVNAVEIEFGRSLRDQALALELGKVDVIESAPQAANGALHGMSSSSTSSLSSPSSLPVELLALVFFSNSKAQDPHLREALALSIDRQPIQSVLLKGAGEPAASILPNWMTGYSAVFSTSENLQRARSLIADGRSPALTLSYDPRDPQAQLIAERIALNAREVSITVQVSLSGVEDIRLVRIVLPSPDPAAALSEAARQLGLSQPVVPVKVGEEALDDLYQAERTLLEGYSVIPLFHLPVESAASARVQNWEPGLLGDWSEPGSSAGNSLEDIWLTESRSGSASP